MKTPLNAGLLCALVVLCLAACAIPSAAGKLLATFVSAQYGTLNLTVIDPSNATITSVLYYNPEYIQAPISPAWDSTNRIMYFPVEGVDTGRPTHHIIGLQIDDDLSNVTLVADWDMQTLFPFTRVRAIHFDSESNRLILIGSTYIYTLDVVTNKAKWATQLPPSLVLDTYSQFGVASAISVKHQILELPTFDTINAEHLLQMFSADSFNSVQFKHQDYVPRAMFLDPSNQIFKAIFSDIGTSSVLTFGTIGARTIYQPKLQWDTKGFTKVYNGLAALDSKNQVFYTLLTDSAGTNIALVTADSNMGVIKQMVEWPQQLPPPSSLLVV